MNSTQVFRLNGYSGGLSDDKFTGINNSFQDGIGVEFRDNPLSLTLQKEYISHDIDGLANVFLRVGDKEYCISSTGHIYEISLEGEVEEKRDDFETAILAAIEYDGYVYFCKDDKLQKIAIDKFIDGTSDDVEDVMDLATGGVKTLITFKTYLIISGGKYLYLHTDELDSSVQLDYKPISISAAGNYIKVYGGNGTDTVITYIGLDNTHKLYIVEIKEWKGTTVYGTINKDGYDYVVADSGLFISQSFSKQLIKKFHVNSSNGLGIINNIIYFNNGNTIYSWGALHKDYPETLGKEITLGDDIKSIGTYGKLLLVGCDSKIYTHNRNGTTYKSTGFIKSRAFIGDSVITSKDTIELRVGYSPLPEDCDITINLYSDFGQEPVSTSVLNIPGTVKYVLPITFRYNILEVEVILNTNNSDITPEILDLMLLYTNADV